MNADHRSFVKRLLHFLAWDDWRIRSDLPAGYRLRRYIAWNGVGAMMALWVLVGLVLWQLDSCPVPGTVVPFIVFCVLSWVFLHFDSRSRLHHVPQRARTRGEYLFAGAYWGSVLIVVIVLVSCKADWGPKMAATGVIVALYAFRIIVVPRTLPESSTHGATDEGRVFAGFVRTALVLWALYLATAPLRPLDIRHPPREWIAEWLLDNGDRIREPVFFPIESIDECPDSAAGVSNLLARVGNPPPADIRLAVALAGLERLFPEGLSPAGDAKTNVVDAAFIREKFGSGFEGWQASFSDSVARFVDIGGFQTDTFAITNGTVNSKYQEFGLFPGYAGAIQHVSWDVVSAADIGSSGQFIDALSRAEALRDAAVRLRGRMVSTLVALLCDGIVVDAVMRFAERPDLKPEDFAAVRAWLASRRQTDFSRRFVQAAADESVFGHLLFAEHDRQEGGCWQLFGKPPMEGFANEGVEFSPLRRKLGGLAMTLGDVDRSAYRALWEEYVEWQVAGAAQRLDPSAQETASPPRRSAWKWTLLRGGFFRAITDYHFDGWLPFIRFEARSRYADAYRAVMETSLLLSEFRAAHGRDADSLEEAAEAVGAEVPEVDLRLLRLQYEGIPKPDAELAPSESSAFLLALVPSLDAPRWFKEQGNGEGWLVVRNPAFPGTRPYRVYRYDGKGKPIDVPESAAALLPAVSDIQFLSVSGPDGVPGVEARLKESGWKL